jgi:hypothetical protein
MLGAESRPALPATHTTEARPKLAYEILFVRAPVGCVYRLRRPVIDPSLL